MRRIRPLVLALACAGALLAPASAQAFEQLSSFGSFGAGAGQIEVPGGIEVGPDGSSYVADYGNNRIDVFSPSGSFVRAFGMKVSPAGGNVCISPCQAGSEDEELKQSAGAMYNPEDVAVDSEGRVFVADSRNNRIDVFSTEGTFIRAFGKDVEAGAGTAGVCTLASGCERGVPDGSAGAISRPFGVAVDASGNVYVADAVNARIDVFSTAGAFVSAFGKGVNAGAGGGNVCTTECQAGESSAAPGAIDEPYDVTVAPDGDLYVADYKAARIDLFTSQGTFLYAFGKEVDPTGANVCTTECQAGEEGGAAGALTGPTAVTTDASGSVYVADENNNRIDEFTAPGGFVRAFGGGVVDGATAFQICSLGSGCQVGGEETIIGAIPGPYGVAVDCRGSVYAIEEKAGFARAERFGEPGTASPPCPAVAPTTPIAPAAPPASAATRPTNAYSIGKLKLNLEKGTAILPVTVPGPGSVVLKGKGIHLVKGTAKKAGIVKLAVKLVGAAQRLLLKNGASKITAKITFTPNGGVSLTKTRKLTLKAALPK
jgi:DNA-binding beta-propeller fold protein YncE